MNPLVKAFSYLIAAHIQALAMIFAAWWIAEELNNRYPIGVSWLTITVPFAVIAIGHTFYLIIRKLYWENQRIGREDDQKKGREDL